MASLSVFVWKAGLVLGTGGAKACVGASRCQHFSFAYTVLRINPGAVTYRRRRHCSVKWDGIDRKAAR